MNHDYKHIRLNGVYSPNIGLWNTSLTVSYNVQDLDHLGAKYNHPVLNYSW